MTDVDDFLAETHPRLVAELQALHNGDPQPRLAMWSTNDPVTLFGAGMSGRGWDEVSGVFRTIASRWSDCTDQGVEIVLARELLGRLISRLTFGAKPEKV